MNDPCAAALARFRDLIGRRLGLAVDGGKACAVFERRIARTRLGEAEYVERLEREAWDEEIDCLARELTVTETYFFRHAGQLEALSDSVLERGAGARIRILSAGCASGEEAYSVAILMRRALALGIDVSIVGIDVNPGMLEKATSGRYSNWSLREMPPDVAARWFKVAGGEFVLDPDVRRMVRFEKRNLVSEDPSFFRSDAFDVVLCRNVLMYFTEKDARATLRRIAGSLSPGGLLFMGHAESLRRLSDDFAVCHRRDAFYYRRRDRREVPGPREPAPAAFSESEPWQAAIERSSKRITRLAGGGLAEAFAAGSPSTREPEWDSDRVAELVHEERFAEVERLLAATREGSEREGERLLLRAVLLTRGRDVGAAVRACEALLSLDETSPGGRYLLALCKESEGDSAGAAEQDLMAARADPSFAMPRLHLGLLARRAGDLPAARRQFVQALALLEREDRARLLLFGGGFTRDALLGLCRAEFHACGGPA